MITIEPANLRDVSYVAANLRAWDREEIYCQLPLGTKPEAIAAHSLAVGEAWTAFYKGLPMAAFGFQTISAGVLTGWAYGRDGMERCIPAITRFVFTYKVPEWLEAGITRIEVRTIETHVSAHRWLEAAGAERICALDQWGRDGERFHLYAWVCDRVPDKIIRRWKNVLYA
ncbi:hypothetical protein [Hoeflea sp. TYP-13]|uniref:hypothetical protein n=1 Tax=Hoeflea sp. TYP-13 TaxID=3230023 RepID=UPI0034C6D382